MKYLNTLLKESLSLRNNSQDPADEAAQVSL